MATTAATAKKKSKGPTTMTKPGTGLGTMGCVLGRSNGMPVLNTSVTQPALLELIKRLPSIIAKWEPGPFKIVIEGEVIKSAAKKPAKKAAKKPAAMKVAPMH